MDVRVVASMVAYCIFHFVRVRAEFFALVGILVFADISKASAVPTLSQADARWLSGLLLSQSKLRDFCSDTSIPRNQRPFRELCDFESELFPSSNNVQSSRARSTLSWKSIDDLQRSDFARLVRFTSTSSEADLLHRGNLALHTKTCPRSLSLAIARSLEKFTSNGSLTTATHAPSAKARTLLRRLFTHGMECIVADDSRATPLLLRMALLELSWNSETTAVRWLTKARPASNHPDYARLLYWRGLMQHQKNQAKVKKAESKTKNKIELLTVADWQTLISDRPSSFHAITAKAHMRRKATDLYQVDTRLASLDTPPPKSPTTPTADKRYMGWLNSLLQVEASSAAERLAAALLRLDRFESSASVLKLFAAFEKSSQVAAQVRLSGRLALWRPDFFSEPLVHKMFPTPFHAEFKKMKRSIDPLLLMSVARQESAFDRTAVSRANARGLLQILPSTARSVGGAKASRQLFEPSQNIALGSQYLRRLTDRFQSLELALAAYNAGSSRVDQWLKIYGRDEADLLFVDLIPFPETRDYVSLVLRNYFWYQELYGRSTVSAINRDLSTLLTSLDALGQSH